MSSIFKETIFLAPFLQLFKNAKIRLSWEQLNRLIPYEIDFLSKLQVILALSKNHISREIPSSLENLVKLQRLNLSVNQLQGKVPPSLGRLSSLHRLNLSHNQLQDQISSTLNNHKIPIAHIFKYIKSIF